MKTPVMILLAAWIAVIAIVAYMRMNYPIRLMSLITMGDFETFDKKASGQAARFFVDRYNLYCLKLNSYIARQSSPLVKKHLEALPETHLNEKQKAYVYAAAFNFFVSMEHKAEAKKYMDLINGLSIDSLKQNARWTYDAVLSNGYAYLDEIQKETGKLPESMRGNNDLLISLMYKNKGDQQKADEYRQKAEKEMQMASQKEEKSR